VYKRRSALWDHFLVKNAVDIEWVIQQDIDQQRAVMVDFVLYMYGEAELGENEISRILSALRHRFICECYSTVVFTDASVLAVKSSVRRGSGRDRNIIKERKRRLPVTLDFVEKARSVLWGAGDIDRNMTYIGIMLAFNFMWRASEYIMDSACDKHAILTDDLVFITHHCTSRYRTWEMASVNGYSIGTILFVIRSSKADRPAQGRYLYLSRKSPVESQLLDDVIFWVKSSGTLIGEPLLSRRKMNNMRVRHKKMTREMMTAALREVAVQCKFTGEMVFAFTPHSLRIGGATSMMASGKDRSVVKRVGGWAYDSSCDEMYYMNTALDDGALSVSRTCFEVLTTEDVMKIVPPSFLHGV